MGSERRVITDKSGSKARVMKKIPKKTPNRWNLGAGSLVAALGALILAFLYTFFISLSAKQPRLPPSLLPFPGPKLSSLPQFSGSYASRMLWGTYRPGVYFGLRPRAQNSMIFGLMWLDPLRRDALTNIRHQAEMRDGLAQYGWLAHDGEGFGRQGILDEGLNITASWVKNKKKQPGSGSNTGSTSNEKESFSYTSWSARIAAQPILQQEPDNPNKSNEINEEKDITRAISFFLYMATEDGSPIQLHTDNLAEILGKFGSTGVLMSGNTHSIGKWKLHLNLPSATDLKIINEKKIDKQAENSEKEQNNEEEEKENQFSSTSSSPIIVEASFMSLRTPHLHNLTEAVHQGLVRSLHAQYEAGKEYKTLSLPNLMDPGSNIAVIHITAVLPTALDIAFTSDPSEPGGGGKHSSKSEKTSGAASATGTTTAGVVVGSELTSSLIDAETAFHSRFEKTFGKLAKPSSKQLLPVGTDAAARGALSNLLGGMGYWYGHSLVKLKKSELIRFPHKTTSRDRSNTNNNMRGEQDNEEIILKMWDTPLYSATPSRSFFPRGFLWDEGFHQVLVQRWNPALSRDALAHWLDLMTVCGWIPREQILGEEARARVPSEFIAQSPDAANPPALFLPLAEMADRVARHSEKQKKNAAEVKSSGGGSGSGDFRDIDDIEKQDLENVKADVEFLRAAWPRLRTWVSWYNESQTGPVDGSFRWRGRQGAEEEELNSNSGNNNHGFSTELNPKTLTSGLDDYPRASHPSKDERHLDLRCWMALAAHSLASVGDAVGAPLEEIAEFRAFAARLDDFEELKQLHWDEKRQKFADWGLHTEDVKLVSENNNGGGDDGNLDLIRVANSPPSLQYVPHYGYLSLFPLIMNLIPKDSPILGQQIAQLRQESELWTPFGLRSLSKSSSLYNSYNTQHDPPYWRGPVWININYLVLRALRRYEQQGGPYAEHAGRTANELRTALMNTLVEQYNARGYLYESYNDENGQGKGCHPFTGWTALLTLIAGEDGYHLQSS